MEQYSLSINGEEVPISTLEELKEALNRAHGEYHEIWLEGSNGTAMMSLINQDQAWAMFLRNREDAGFSTRNPDVIGNPETSIEFLLSNGQMDTYPAAWVVKKSEVMDALLHFFLTGEKSPHIAWCDN